MTFYRVQKENGCGVYRGDGDDNGLRIMEAIESQFKHPTPSNDSLLIENSIKFAGDKDKCGMESWGVFFFNSSFLDPFIFGFSSMDSLNSWFYNEEARIALKQIGYKIFKVDLNSSEMIKGNSQSIALKKAFDAAKKEISDLTSA